LFRVAKVNGFQIRISPGPPWLHQLSKKEEIDRNSGIIRTPLSASFPKWADDGTMMATPVAAYSAAWASLMPPAGLRFPE